MEAFSALLAICAGNSPVSGEFPAQRPVTRSFDVFFELRLNKQLSKQSWGWWFETPSRPLWRHSNGCRICWGCTRWLAAGCANVAPWKSYFSSRNKAAIRTQHVRNHIEHFCRLTSRISSGRVDFVSFFSMAVPDWKWLLVWAWVVEPGTSDSTAVQHGNTAYWNRQPYSHQASCKSRQVTQTVTEH